MCCSSKGVYGAATIPVEMSLPQWPQPTWPRRGFGFAAATTTQAPQEHLTVMPAPLPLLTYTMPLGGAPAPPAVHRLWASLPPLTVGQGNVAPVTSLWVRLLHHVSTPRTVRKVGATAAHRSRAGRRG